jgi:hypothetical protein
MALLEQVGFVVDVDNGDGTFILSLVVLRTVRTYGTGGYTFEKRDAYPPGRANCART